MTGYAGDLTPQAAWQRLAEDPAAVLVDVRTEPEWRFVGMPDLAPLGKAAIPIAWQDYPAMAVNPRFAELVEAAGARHDAPVLLLCRSGARSVAAAKALNAAGFAFAFNISDGFEGPLDGAGRRGVEAGWKVAGLPWRQS